MKSIISKFFIGAALVAMTGLSACTGDLDQLPKDPNVLTPDQFQKDPKGYLGGILGKCYSSLAISGQYGPNGAADINGMDGGTSQYTRVMFYLEDLPTDIGLWIYQDAGVTPWNATDYTLDNIGNERAREFYHEGMRRTDLNRMNKFTGSAYNWTLKGGIQDGTALPSYMRLYPLPTNVIAGYGSSMVQNEGY